MESAAMVIDSTTSKIQQLQKAFAELESHRAVTLNLKWKELEEHFHGLQRSLKRRFTELEDQEKQFENKTMEAQGMLEERKEAIVAKEQALLGRLQEKRDAAVSAITCKLENRQKALPASLVEEKPHGSMDLESNIAKPMNSSENQNMNMFEDKLNSFPQLVKICEEMDAGALHKFISDNRKDLAALREAIPLALKVTPDPAGLVLASLENFYETEVPNLDGKKDSGLLGLRRTCIMLMECLETVLSQPHMGDVISKAARDHARSIAQEWKPKLDDLDMDAGNGNSLEAHAFLQLLATFGIYSDFEEEEMTKLIPKVCRRRQTADLCRSLGLADKMPGVLEELINSGRQIDAVNLAFALDLTGQFSPVPLLKAHLKEAKKAPSPVKPGNTSPTAQKETNEQELAAHKAVLKCIEEHKLEHQYPPEPLQRRVTQLEKAKADKKRVTEAAKPQPKRPRAGSVGFGPRSTNTVPADKSFYGGRYAQYMYERPYLYPGQPENRRQGLFTSAAYNLLPAHGSYFGNGYQYQVPVPYLFTST